MNCPKCGAQSPPDAQVCLSCSAVLSAAPAADPNQQPKTSGMAITSLVLGILSPFTCLLTALPAIILAIVALAKIRKSAGQLKGNGLAVTGIVLPAVAVPVIAMLMAILMPALARARAMAQRHVCTANVRQIGIAMHMYANDHGTYPDPDRWCDILVETGYIDRQLLRCRAAKRGPGNYAMNKNMKTLGPNAHPGIVLLFETQPGWNQAGGPEAIDTQNHLPEGATILFVDAHVEFRTPQDFDRLKWTDD